MVLRKDMSISEEKEIEEMRKNKKSYVDSIAEESDMESEKGREIIREALDEKIITEEFADAKIEDNSIGPSLIEDAKHTIGSKGASRSRAKISDIQVQNDNIEIGFSIIGKSETFGRQYNIQDSNGLNEELKNIFILTDIKPSRPNELKGCIVPVKPSSGHGGIEYTIDTPPKTLGLGNRIQYRLNRIIRRMELVRHRKDRYSKDRYTPTGRLYFILLSIASMSSLFGITGMTVSIILVTFTVSLFLLHMEVKENLPE